MIQSSAVIEKETFTLKSGFSEACRWEAERNLINLNISFSIISQHVDT